MPTPHLHLSNALVLSAIAKLITLLFLLLVDALNILGVMPLTGTEPCPYCTWSNMSSYLVPSVTESLRLSLSLDDDECLAGLTVLTSLGSDTTVERLLRCLRRESVVWSDSEPESSSSWCERDLCDRWDRCDRCDDLLTVVPASSLSSSVLLRCLRRCVRREEPT